MQQRVAAVAILAWLFFCACVGASTREQALEDFRDQTRNVAYNLGACNQNSMDCSCLVQRLYLEKFGLPLPRTTLTQVKQLEQRNQRQLGFEHYSHLRPEGLCPGDLIYTHKAAIWERSSRHVVVYMGQGKILHASSSRKRVVVDPLDILRRYHLKGVYRPLNCRGGALPPSSSGRSKDDGAIEEFIEDYFASWNNHDLAAYERFWRPGAMQWALGELLDLPKILRRRQLDLQGLKSVQTSYQQHSLDVFGQRALVEVVYNLERTYQEHRRIDDDQRESFVLQKDAGRWRIVYSETYLYGD